MLCRYCDLRCLRNRKINTVLVEGRGGGGGSVSKTQNIEFYCQVSQHFCCSLCVESILIFTSPLSSLKIPSKKDRSKKRKTKIHNSKYPTKKAASEMSENFEGALHDVETGEERENENSEEENEDESEVDKQMGEVDGQDTEKLDEKIWGDSDEEDEKEVDRKKQIDRIKSCSLYVSVKQGLLMTMKAWSHKCKVYYVTRQKFGLVYLVWPCLVHPISKGH